jgi:hypothetical protein
MTLRCHIAHSKPIAKQHAHAYTLTGCIVLYDS